MKTRYFKTIVSTLLVLCLTLGLIPISVFAETTNTVNTSIDDLIAGVTSVDEMFGTLDPATVPEIVGYENAVARTHIRRLYEEEGNQLNKLVFLNADGTQTAYIYDYPVKFTDANGNIKDVTLNIGAGNTSGQFESKASSAITTFSKNVSDGIILNGNGARISLIPHIPERLSSGAFSSDELSAKNDNDGLTLSTAKMLNDKTVAYPYDAKTSIEYSLTYTGFKEDIVVSEYTGQTEYEFTLVTNGLKLVETDGSLYLIDENSVVKATLGDIIIFTADEAYNGMGEMTFETVVEKQEYLLTIHVDADYLSDEKTVYPIRIDPTVEICYDNNGAGAIADVTLNSNSGSSGTSGSLSVGLRETYGISRILMKFPGLNLSSLGNNITITNASVELRDLMCEGVALDVSCYVFSGNEWNESTVNWSNVSPNSISTFLSSNSISYANGKQQATAHRYVFDITAAVEGWRTGNYNPNKGIIFKASSTVENGTTYNCKTIASYNRASYKPSLSVTYSTTSNFLSNDTYYLNNRYCGDYLRYSSSAATASSGLISSLGNSIRWEIVSVNGGYAIRSKSDTSKYLGVPSSTSSISVSIVTVTDATIPSRCIWSIRNAYGGGCLVQNTYNSKYLFSYGNSAYTSSSTGSTGTSAYDSRVWRIARISYYGNSSSNSKRELQSGFSINPLVVNIGENKSPSISKYPSNSLWANASDFSYTYQSGSGNCASFEYRSGVATGDSIGISTYKATHKVTNRTYSFTVYVDQYTYELNNFFDFTPEVSLLIRDLYNRIDTEYSSKNAKYRAWVASRVLSEFSYDSTTTYLWIIPINKWDDVAGSVTSPSSKKSFFVDTLGYTSSEYDTLNSALTSQHANTQTSDFTHMQYSLAARLAYKLDQDGLLSNIYTQSGNEFVSYLAGWLGDATVTNDGKTSFGNDDYMADLDAENLFRDINGGDNSITAINNYYRTISRGNETRATIFKSYISYSSAEEMVLDELNKSLSEVRTSYPDTYDFLMSLKNGLSEISDY